MDVIVNVDVVVSSTTTSFAFAFAPTARRDERRGVTGSVVSTHIVGVGRPRAGAGGGGARVGIK
jgi:hypothetical protein